MRFAHFRHELHRSFSPRLKPAFRISEPLASNQQVMSRSIKKHRNRMSCAELRGQSLTSFPGNIQEVRVAASGRSRRSDFLCTERKDVGSRKGGQDLRRRLGSFVNSESRVRTYGTLRGDRVTRSTTGIVQTLKHLLCKAKCI